ncbi:hypothetical protein S40293_10221 [Stachybotrys chartarum IBT 40293]|nr:hypothetical protein S40293_10221 [Stachybotrys chartarum IBT 40293]
MSRGTTGLGWASDDQLHYRSDVLRRFGVGAPFSISLLEREMERENEQAVDAS